MRLTMLGQSVLQSFKRINPFIKILVASGFLFLLGCVTDGPVARGSVVENEIVGFVRTSDGNAAVGSRVQLFSASSKDFGATSVPTKLGETTTDQNGSYRFSKLDTGVYGVLSQYDTLFAFHDSISIAGSGAGKNDTVLVAADTLKATGAISAQVIMRNGDDPATVTGVVIGTGLNSHPKISGDISMVGMPAGKLRLRFTSSLPGYKPLEVSVQVTPGITKVVGALVLP